MLIHPHFNPIAVTLGPLKVHWYGLMYLVGFVAFYFLANRRAQRAPFVGAGWDRQKVEDLLFVGVLGVVLGGRLGYVLFYKPDYYIDHLTEIFAVWQGGMSFHGGFLGVIAAMYLYGRRQGMHFFEVADLVAPCVPVGLAAGRIGNFINGELWGRAADPSLPWAMIFPESGSNLPRHPSQLYEFGLEGVLLFTVLWIYGRKPRPLGAVSGLFMLGYGLMRFTAEYFREPDSFLGLLALNMSMGQWLCVPMIVLGALLFILAKKDAFQPKGRKA
ncbi:MAG: prolipoprotein diacylglyceryl transferase [Burkholderiales bacterium]|nr:prolipoprotein diacylglyceryl transferase [Burkholderiales bacterium]MDE2075529.1 prolipoprotein diacylglyceryl transferase [Burkholderiales bacterium]MDE2432507.1 prolipoprotein diacylglyceryl transferase [Burkholderiales bacterium]